MRLAAPRIRTHRCCRRQPSPRRSKNSRRGMQLARRSLFLRARVRAQGRRGGARRRVERVHVRLAQRGGAPRDGARARTNGPKPASSPNRCLRGTRAGARGGGHATPRPRPAYAPCDARGSGRAARLARWCVERSFARRRSFFALRRAPGESALDARSRRQLRGRFCRRVAARFGRGRVHARRAGSRRGDARVGCRRLAGALAGAVPLRPAACVSSSLE
mmetsp:Transcript_40215/g.99389  ORF Transcript_40215/g.99389 Transcript_40215/m.99389 type:complete len:219 (+) Transcript_40215:292-948(+)